MPTKTRLLSAHSTIFIVLLLSILALVFGIRQVSAIDATRPTNLRTDANLDEMATAWQAFTEMPPTPGLPTPSWEISNVSSPSLDGRSLRCAVTSGVAYSNLHCYRNLAADLNSNTFMMSLSFYYRPHSTFNNQGGSSIVQALEFTMSKWNGPLRYEWAVQWENVGDGAPKWRYWDPHHLDSNNMPDRWVDLNITVPRELLELEGERWYTLKLEGDIVTGQVYYHRFSIDKLNDGVSGRVYPLDITVRPAEEAGDKLAVALQLDGNNWNGTGQLSPYEVFLDQVNLAHVNGTSIDHFISNTLRGTFLLSTGQSARQSYAGLEGGLVKITSTRGIPIIAAQRVLQKANGIPTSFSEMMALPNSQLNTTYWLPWYNNKDLDTQLQLANVSNSPATINIFIAGSAVTPTSIVIPAGTTVRRSFPGIDNGPVRIAGNVNILASERVIYKVNGIPTSFSEMMALPTSQLSNTYWLPWYNNVDLDTQLRFANVSSSPATVRVYIGGMEIPSSPFTLAVGASTRRSFAVNNGPVKIVSTQNIVAAERVIYKVNNINTSFTEMMALPNGQLSATYWLPWYNNVGDLDTQLRFANVSSSPATVHVYVGGVEMTGSPFTLAGGASTRKRFTGINNGPVQIASNVNIVVSERVIYKINNVNTSFAEMMALPDSQLNTIYWLPLYNNVSLDTQLRFGVP